MPFDDLNYVAVLDCPLLSVHHTRFACGGVCIGVHMSHYIGDGDAYFGLIRDWAHIYRHQQRSNEPVQMPRPCIDRRWMRPTAAEASEWACDASASMQPRATAVAHQSSDHTKTQSTFASRSQTSLTMPFILRSDAVAAAEANAKSHTRTDRGVMVSPPVIVIGVLRFTSGECARIKKAAVAALPEFVNASVDVGDDIGSQCHPNTDGWVSTVEALTAHIAIHLFDARQQERDTQQADTSAAAGHALISDTPSSSDSNSNSDPVLVDFVVNLRNCWSSRLPMQPTAGGAPALFGNYVCNYNLPASIEVPRSMFACSTSSPSDVECDSRLVLLASALHHHMRAAIASPKYWQQTLTWLDEQRRHAQPVVIRSQGIGPGHSNLFVSAMGKFGVYRQCTFEPNSAPLRVCFPPDPYSVDGLTTMIATPDEGMEVWIGCDARVWDRVRCNPQMHRFA